MYTCRCTQLRVRLLSVVIINFLNQAFAESLGTRLIISYTGTVLLIAKYVHINLHVLGYAMVYNTV